MAVKTYIIKKVRDCIPNYYYEGQRLSERKTTCTWGPNPHKAKEFKTRNEADIEQHLLDLGGRVVCLTY